MDLILLRFGEPDFVKDSFGHSDATDSSLEASERQNMASILIGEDESSFDFSNCIELVSINQGIQQQVTTDVSNSARTTGRPIISDFTCVKYADRTSPKLYDYCLRAKPVDNSGGNPTTIYVLRNSGEQFSVVIQFELRLAMISEIQFQSHPNDMATEQFRLSFTEISWCHEVQGENGRDRAFSKSGWDVAKNCPISELSR
jgi:type VI secretion system secreted protein Hcp